MSWKQTGVNNALEAGEQNASTGINIDEVTLEDLGFETGEEEDAGEAGQKVHDDFEGEPKQLEEPAEEDAPFGDQRQEKAWAKRIAAEREKIRREVEDEYQQKTQHNQAQRSQAQYEQQYEQQQYQPHQPYQPTRQPQQQKPWVEPQPLTKDELSKLADDYAMTTDAVQVLYNQQVEMNRMKYLLEQSFHAINAMRDDTTKTDAVEQIERMRKSNPHLPAFDSEKVSAIRQNYRQRHGINLPWADAYKQLVADEAMSGNMSRQAQQKAIKQITGRNRTNVQVGNAAQVKQISVEDLSDAQFERLIERAKAGAFTRNK